MMSSACFFASKMFEMCLICMQIYLLADEIYASAPPTTSSANPPLQIRNSIVDVPDQPFREK